MVYTLSDGDITGETFRAFVKYCLEHSTHFSVTLHEYKEAADDSDLDCISNGFYKRIQSFVWYRYQVFLEPLMIGLYHSDLSMLDGLMELFPGLFSPKTMRFPQKNKVWIEDLCFMRGDKFLFGSVSHESIAEIRLDSESELEFFEKFGKWESCMLTERDSELIPDLAKLL